MTNKKMILAATLMAAAMSMQAVPAYRQAVQRTQPDGSTVTVMVTGDEHRHLLTTIDGHTLMQDAEGWLRYARLEQGKLTCAGAPVAHNLAQRTTAELAYLSTADTSISLEALPLSRIPAASRRAGALGEGNDIIQIGEFPTRGEIHALIVLAEFADVKFSTDASYISSMMSDEGFTGSSEMGSARDYFISQSNGQFLPSFDVVGPVTLNHQMKYYGGNNFWGSDERSEYMIRDACQMAHDRFDVDFSKYDYDEDGKVDMVYVIYAGYGENYGASEDCVWPHKFELSNVGIDLHLNDKQVDTYACSCELIGTSGTTPAGIGTFCHEFSHVLGLADHYSTNNQTDMMLGRYDVMDYGCYNDDTCTPCGYTAFERYSVQWMDLEEIDEPADGLRLEHVATSHQAYKLQTPNPNEYFLLETRLQRGWDSFIPSQGLMITHINYNRSDWSRNIVNNGSFPGYCLVPADGIRSYENDGRDLFPQRGVSQQSMMTNSFTDETTPSQLTYDGKTTNRWVTNIAVGKDGAVTFDFMTNAVGKVHTLPVESLWRTGFTAEWTPAKRAEYYSVDLFRYDTLATRPVVVNEDFNLFASGSYASPDVTELSDKLDQYMSMPGWTGDRICQAGGMARLGAANISGTLTTPVLDLSKSQGCFTVIVKAQGFTGKSPVLTITANGYEAKHRITASQKEYAYVFYGGTEETQITFATNKERVYLDDLYIKRGNALSEHPDANVVDVKAPEGTETAEPGTDDNDGDLAFSRVYVTTVDSIQNCWYSFANLDTDMRYGFVVRAWRGQASSEPSPEVEVVLLGTMGIDQVCDDNKTDSRPAIYDLNGHRVAGDRLQAGRLYISTQDRKKFIVR